MMRARFVVRGMVQGVYFRVEAMREATTRGLTGRVWNRSDDAVEVIAEGDADGISALHEWLKRGPRMAQVQRVERTDLAGDRRYRDFSIVHAAPE